MSDEERDRRRRRLKDDTNDDTTQLGRAPVDARAVPGLEATSTSSTTITTFDDFATASASVTYTTSASSLPVALSTEAKSGGVSHLEQQLQDNAAAIRLVEAEIQEVGASIRKVESELDTVNSDFKKTELEQDQKDLRDEKKRLAERERRLGEKERRLGEKERQLREKERQLREKERQLREQLLKTQTAATESEVLDIAPIGYNGIWLSEREYILPRDELLSRLYDMVTGHNRFVHIAAPAGFGKTSLLQLFKQYCAAKRAGVQCIYVVMTVETFPELLQIRSGINSRLWTVEPGSLCSDTKRIFVVMFDDAHMKYKDTVFWNGLIKGDIEGGHDLPKNIRFLISATYSLVTLDTPLVFSLLPKLTLRDLRLSNAETNEFIRLQSKRLFLQGLKGSDLLINPVIREFIAFMCNGHIGAIALYVIETCTHFRHHLSVTEGDIVQFFISHVLLNCFNRCFVTGLTELPEDIRGALSRILVQGSQCFWNNPPPEAVLRLIRAGVLEEVYGTGQVAFSSPVAAMFINHLIFPLRSTKSSTEVRNNGIVAFMKAVVGRMSASALNHSVIPQSGDLPSEATFQHLLMAPLLAETPKGCFVCPELSKVFPYETSSPRDENASSAAVASSSSSVVRFSPQERIPGRCDFFLNGDLRWAIEALINGDAIGEHLNRFASHGKYLGLSYDDYLVIDFRLTKTGHPTAVDRHERRMTVFFKENDDYSSCYVLCGLDGPADRIALAP